jgi:hypothetical protein
VWLDLVTQDLKCALGAGRARTQCFVPFVHLQEFEWPFVFVLNASLLGWPQRKLGLDFCLCRGWGWVGTAYSWSQPVDDRMALGQHLWFL